MHTEGKANARSRKRYSQSRLARRRACAPRVLQAQIMFPQAARSGTGCCSQRSKISPRIPSRTASSVGVRSTFKIQPPIVAHFVGAHAAGRQRRRADADAGRVHRLALVVGDHVLVDGDAAVAERFFGLLAGDAQRGHVDQHQVVVGAAADQPQAAGGQASRPASWRFRSPARCSRGSRA